MTKDIANKYLFHWLSLDRFEKFSNKNILKPYWTHFIRDENKFVRGISTCKEPMLWNPDEEKPREPCLIIDHSLIDATKYLLDSGNTYYLTKEIKRAIKAGESYDDIILKNIKKEKISRPSLDEVFINGNILREHIVAIGYEFDELNPDNFNTIETCANKLDLPLLNMSEWVVSSPGYSETDEIIDNLIGNSLYVKM